MNSLKSSHPGPRASTPSLFVHYWLPVLLWMAFIFWMSTETFSSENTSSVVENVLSFLVPAISAQQMDLVHAFLRKTAHVTEYFILGLLLFRAYRANSTASWSWRWLWGALIVVVAWATIDEFHQSFVPTREGSYVDVGIDTAGGLLAQLVSVWRHRYRKK